MTPQQIASRCEKFYGIKVVALAGASPRLRFLLCPHGSDALQPAARRLADFLESRRD